MRYIQSKICDKIDVHAGTTKSYDLPINPVTMCEMKLTWTTATATPNLYDYIEEAMNVITKIDISYKGRTLYSASAENAAMLSRLISGAEPTLIYPNPANAAIRSLVIPICLSPYLFDPGWASPASKRGELQLQITCEAPSAQITSASYSIEAIELEAAEPAYYMQATPHAVVPVAEGEIDIDLPIGNDIIGIMIYANKIPDSTNELCSVGSLALLVDNREEYINHISWGSLRLMAQMRAPEMIANSPHYHKLMTIVEGNPTSQSYSGNIYSHHYGYIDLMPNGMEEYVLATTGHSRIHLAIECEDPTQISVWPIQRVVIPS